jgi:hypothetical protein
MPTIEKGKKGIHLKRCNGNESYMKVWTEFVTMLTVVLPLYATYVFRIISYV